ncbi:hypothetical protein [Priestia taiwanensis]|uniref:YfjL-like N-terminal domain-containing protein n=1 Tax=Priestia taiwanensis TaxID=1347902 RepID=A0A917AKI5_9BACI|nr:hypothetical protein [Priestia taiwanensis]MBM7362071.1 hypothetical protein [Priestia taiwanensis]GGE59192.1 hypothetical protein GCM10007140_06940 [Priestia taiwanensis]
MKWFLRIVAVGIIAFIGFLYFSFAGLPWKERAIGKEIQEHLDKKYNVKTNIKETFYNFKHGIYGAHIYIEGEEGNLEFYAEKVTDGIRDTYGERLWSWQMKNEMGPILKKHVPNLGSHGADLQPTTPYDGSGIIPHYKDAGQAFFYRIVLDKPWNEVDEQAVHEGLFHVIQEMKDKGINTITLYLSPVFVHTKAPDPKNIRIRNTDMEQIKTKEDIAKYVITSDGSPY